MRASSWTLGVGLAAALLALRPVGPVERVAEVVVLPSRLAAPLGAAPTLVARARGPATSGADPEVLAAETLLSARLERAVLRSAWPERVPLAPHVAPIPGEVDARLGRSRDVIRVRVAEPERVQVGQPVVAGDVYVGRVSRIPFREDPPDDPDPFERLLRAARLSVAPRRPPRDAVDVALVTGAAERVGALALPGGDARPCRMVVGGLAWPRDRVWLAVHTPESRTTRSGRVVVNEPLGRAEAARVGGLGTGFESLGEEFELGELVFNQVQRPGEPFEREVLGVKPLVDFSNGLNQVLVLAPAPAGVALPVDHDALRARIPVVPVLEDGGWGPARLLVAGDTRSWRASLRIDRGTRAGVVPGAAVVEGVRLVGRVNDPSPLTSAVVGLADPGFRVAVLAQDLDDPDGPPLAMGELVARGRGPDGAARFTWQPDGGTRWPHWFSSARGPVAVALWTGSGMERVPRGLAVGRTVLDPVEARAAAEADGSVTLRIERTATLRGPFQIRLGSARLGPAAARPGGEAGR